MLDIFEIVDAWIASRNPSSARRDLAYKRYEICTKCEHNRTVLRKFAPTEICNICKCALSAKIFSSKKNSCPLEKWDVVDFENVMFKTEKKDKTLI